MLFGAAAFSQDPDLDDDERSALEEIFRTSEEDGEIPTSTRGRKRVSAPKGAIRIGCVCMDGSTSDAHSAGACSGSGGVRFWLYRTLEGDTAKIITGRHERHPQPLDSLELAETNRARIRKPTSPGGPVQPILQPLLIQPMTPAMPGNGVVSDGGWFDWSDAATVSGGGMALYFTVRYLLRWIHEHQTLVRYALRHMLRFGKRPIPRKSRKNTGKTRL